MKTNPFLVIDVGNTSAKWAIANQSRILKEYEFPTKNFLKNGNQKTSGLSASHHFSGAIVSSVVPAAVPGIKKHLRKLGVHRPWIVSSKMDLGIKIRYPEPQKIGADRLVNSVAAIELYGAPAVVVDFGTAVTFDVISAKGEYLGGAIAPGLKVMTHDLHQQTALLPEISLAEPSTAIGKNTVSAMRIGAVIGYRGLVREILHSICREMSRGKRTRKIQIIATGGHSALIASKIPEIHHIDPQLTLHGLRVLYLRQANG